MYTFTEIEKIYNSCSSNEELQLVTEAFSDVMLDRDISSKKMFFIRKMERIKKRELANLKKKS